MTIFPDNQVMLLNRIGRCVQVPARRSAGRDEARIAAWRDETRPVARPAADLGAWLRNSGHGVRLTQSWPCSCGLSS